MASSTFFAGGRAGREWRWDDVEMVWVAAPDKGEFKMPNGMTVEYEIQDGW